MGRRFVWAGLAAAALFSPVAPIPAHPRPLPLSPITHVVVIDQENRSFDHFRDVGSVHRRAPFFGQCGETDLVIHNHVQRAASAITG